MGWSYCESEKTIGCRSCGCNRTRALWVLEKRGSVLQLNALKDIYGDNGSLMYHLECGYPPYGAYPPAGSLVPTIGHDGLLYGLQHYQYATHYYQQPTTTDGTYSLAPTPIGDLSTSIA
ncbi:hypothetical protein AAC387_Pa05g0473 [Persea americana]